VGNNITHRPKILLFDVELAPILGYVWALFDQNVGLNQIYKDWHFLSWAAKWFDEETIFYMDNRDAKNIEDDKKILHGLWDLLDEADIVVTQNGKKFDSKKANARFILNGMKPPSPYRHIDTLILAKRHFGFTSNKLEYLTDKLNKKHKKSQHKKFTGFELWSECLKGNKEAWEEMRLYNIDDILSLEELYKKLIPWDNSINFNVYHDEEDTFCTCGSTRLIKNGYSHTNAGRFHRYYCKDCGSNVRDKKNLLEKTKKSFLKAKI